MTSQSNSSTYPKTVVDGTFGSQVCSLQKWQQHKECCDKFHCEGLIWMKWLRNLGVAVVLSETGSSSSGRTEPEPSHVHILKTYVCYQCFQSDVRGDYVFKNIGNTIAQMFFCSRLHKGWKTRSKKEINQNCKSNKVNWNVWRKIKNTN